MHSAVHDTIAAVWRAESASIVAAVARRVRDIGVAEELAQDALLAALERWPLDGLPDRPAAWLMTTAIHRALDHLRHRQMADARHSDMAADLQALQAHVVPDFSDSLDRRREQAQLADDLLRLMFTACHPVLSAEARVALTLRLLGGLSTAEIAACHAQAARTEDTDWPRIAALYTELMRVAPSPVVELNRAVAVGMAEGPAAALALLTPLLQNPALARYHWLPAVQADLLARLGRSSQAHAALLHAAALATNEREKALLLARADALPAADSTTGNRSTAPR